ncbi:bifunctional metallophosphatase/5'-nucleotidase [Streptomyces sp. RerS4]|uniref:bifunctional metallophosphatase/5'-nucleotidase n=1 Tax=Streptomyces sp. RerS4 TaxID=2942449 RepID=UPI00201C4E35|nr:bifunctional metallophosphatase/5'-nucleotidase [Streptomyces sp. RerS4]UQW99541.1 bifunctional metallophosphatase/5'-nucleotidase [Streptomyces sp. RerS4]
MTRSDRARTRTEPTSRSRGWRELGRRDFLTAAGAWAATIATGVPAYATDAARDAAHADEYVDVQLLGITDLHGYLQAPPGGDSVITGNGGVRYTVGGVAYLAAHLERLRDGRRNSLFCTQGDAFAGWEFDAMAFADEPTVEALNRMGLDFATAGNHEFDKTPAMLLRHMGQGVPFPVVGRDATFTDSTGLPFHGSDFPYYSANLVRTADGQPVLPPYHTEWVTAPDGRRLPIGFIHLTAIGTERFPGSYHPGLATLDAVETANACAERLRSQGVNAIVLSLHDGAVAGGDFNSGTDPSGPAFDLALRVSPAIDAIVTGHWHRRFNMMLPDPEGRPRPFVEAGCHGQVVNEISLRLDPTTGAVVRELTVSTNHPNTRDIAPDPALKEVTDYWAGQATARDRAPIGRQTGSYTRTRNAAGESTMGDLVADWALWAGSRPTDPDDDANVHPNVPAHLAVVPVAPRMGQAVLAGDLLRDTATDGAVSFGRAWRAVGFGDPVVTAWVSGRQLHDALEQQWTREPDGSLRYAPLAVSRNVRYTYDPEGAVGDRVAPADVLVDGRPLDPAARYRLAALSYTFLGLDGYPALTDFEEPYRHQRDYESFIAYVRETEVLTPAPLGRVAVRDTAQAAGEHGTVVDPPLPLHPDGTPLPRPQAAIVTAGLPHARADDRRPPC